MKKILLLCVLALSGCNYFDVSPRTEVRAEDVFKTEQGYWDALTGLYIGMSDQTAYGRYLSWDGIEFMAWNHANKQRTSSWYALQHYDYTAQGAKLFTELVWSKLYNVIAEANYLLYAVDEWGGYLSEDVRRTVRGEALAVRAYCHFDLLRLYAPVPTAENLGKMCIPYVTRYDKHTPQQRSYSATLGLLRNDLDEAARLLDERTLPESRRMYRSNTNLNWAAVQLLRARVGLWSGDANTLSYAQTLIDYINAGAARWQMDDANFSVAGAYKSQVWENEVLFGLNVWELKEISKESWEAYPPNSSNLNDNLLAEPKDNFVLTDLYAYGIPVLGTSASDIRLQRWYSPNPTVNRYMTVKIRNGGTNARSLVPLIRMSEAWLIGAEAAMADNKPQAVEWLNFLRSKRNVSSGYGVPADVSDQVLRQVITLECRREFAQEGQTFFLYKRLGVTNIPGSPAGTAMTHEKYTLPYPQIDTEFGIKQ